MSARDLMPEWSEKVGEDIAFLTECFAEVLTELGEKRLVAFLPWHPSYHPRESMVQFPDSTVNEQLQVMSIAYHLLNIVEENAAALGRRERERHLGLLHEPGLWGRGLKRLRDEGFSEKEILDSLKNMDVEVVLTAHPTEAKRPVVLRQHRALYDEYTKLEGTDWTPYERTAIRERIKAHLERLWRTGEMHMKKPDVLSELEDMCDYLGMVFPRAVLKLHQRFQSAWAEAGFNPAALREADAGPRLFFGNWVGGDRDGHPLVTAEVTRQTLTRLRKGALDQVRSRLEALADNLTLSDLFQEAPANFLDVLVERKQLLSPAALEALAATPHEPWRCFVFVLRLLMDDAQNTPGNPYARPEALRADLMTLVASLEAVGARRLVDTEVAPVLLHLDTFGYHMATLDIRQNSDFHAIALAQLLQAAGFEDCDYEHWDYAKRRAFLDHELRSLRPIAPRQGDVGPEARAMLDLYQVVADHIRLFGSGGIGSFIVSMTRDENDLLIVYLFAREVGLVFAGAGGFTCALDVVPLFETMEDLEGSPAILEAFLSHPITRQKAGQPQQVMVGYSDSNKSGGMFASQWALNQAQGKLAEVCRSHGRAIYFFHGRGGTFSRGAGPTNQFLEALPPGSLAGRVRLTEQGEVIGQKFGNLPTAVYNLELLTAGVTVATLQHNLRSPAGPQLESIGEMLSQFSQEAYRALLESPGFIKFWAAATPIDALEQSFIGSRPTRRTGKRTIADLRAIPWVFSWTQARYYLPGWYGVGTALERLERERPDDYETLRRESGGWPFVRYVLYNVENSLASADLAIMEQYASLVKDPVFRQEHFERIAGEYLRTEKMLDRFFGATRAERRPRLTRTLEMRAEGLRQLHTLQIQLLEEWRGFRAANLDIEARALMPSLLLSVNAIASAERTTG
jgi:phosphoenolpyruvate carboxylase